MGRDKSRCTTGLCSWSFALSHLYKRFRRRSNVKFFADDTSLFSIVQDPEASFEMLQHDLDSITEWAHQWKMSFNPDPTKPAEEILFSHKKNKPYHPPLKFNNMEVKRVIEHKHLGLILDPKLSFLKHN